MLAIERAPDCFAAVSADHLNVLYEGNQHESGQAFAGIALPNSASVALHESVGFTPIGVYRRVGFKHGACRDVGWWQKELQLPSIPEQPGRLPVS